MTYRDRTPSCLSRYSALSCASSRHRHRTTVGHPASCWIPAAAWAWAITCRNRTRTSASPRAHVATPGGRPQHSRDFRPQTRHGRRAGQTVRRLSALLQRGKILHSPLGGSDLKIVAWVGATCAGCAPPVSCLGEFHLSGQRPHPSARRQLARRRLGLPYVARSRRSDLREDQERQDQPR